MIIPTHDITKSTKDIFFNSKLIIHQPENGYRSSIDSLLLIWFAHIHGRYGSCADLGSGCGIIGLSLLSSGRAANVDAVEIQKELYLLAIKNSTTNQLDNNYNVNLSDLNDSSCVLKEKSYMTVVCNPPFFKKSSTKLPHNEQVQIAKHEIMIDINQIFKISKRVLTQKKSSFFIVFPANRIGDLFEAASSVGMGCKRILNVHSLPEKSAELILCQFTDGKKQETIMEPQIFLKTSDGKDSEIAKIVTTGQFFK